MCVCYGLEDGVTREEPIAPSSKPNNRRVRETKTRILRDWYIGDSKQIVNTKRGQIVGFGDITSEFAPEFGGLKDLAEELRNVLFRSRDLAPFTRTYKDHNIMYNGMINVFNGVIDRLRKEE
jgi:hypothetical protein